MEDEASLVLPPRDYSEVAKLLDDPALDTFSGLTPKAIVEVIIGALASGKMGLLASGGRLGLAIFTGRIREQVADEVNRLKEAGNENLG